MTIHVAADAPTDFSAEVFARVDRKSGEGGVGSLGDAFVLLPEPACDLPPGAAQCPPPHEQRQVSPRLDANGDFGRAAQRLDRGRLRQSDHLVVCGGEEEDRCLDVRQSSETAQRRKTIARQPVFAKNPFRRLGGSRHPADRPSARSNRRTLRSAPRRSRIAEPRLNSPESSSDQRASDIGPETRPPANAMICSIVACGTAASARVTRDSAAERSIGAPASTNLETLSGKRAAYGVVFAHFTQPYQPSPKTSSGRPAHRPFRDPMRRW